MPSEYRRYCLTLTVVDQSQRDKFRRLSRPDTFFEIRPNREAGERGAYSVEMNDEEYREALRDAEDPESNLIAIEPNRRSYPRASGIPGSAALQYVAADNADSLGLTGKNVVVAILDTGCAQAVMNALGNSVKASKSFADQLFVPGEGLRPDGGPFEDNNSHGTGMASIALPPAATAVIAKIGQGATDSDKMAAGFYWAADEVGVQIINYSFGSEDESTVERDAMTHAASKGILVFAAAGNSGGAMDASASYPGILAISCYDTETDAIDSSSSRGSQIWAAAPGGYVCSYKRDVSIECLSANSGATSNACAMASHVAARFMSGGVSAGNVKKYLESTARRTGASPTLEGHGVLQLAAAWNKLKDDQAPPTNTDGGIPLPNGGRVQLPAQSGTYIDPDLPINTTVYPTGEADFSTKAGSFILPEGGSAQVASGTTLPAGWPTTGDLPLSENSQVTGPTPDGAAGGYCPDKACPDGSMPPGGGGSGGTGGQYAMLFENFDMTNSAWQVVRDCLALIWASDDAGLYAPSGFAGYDIADLSGIPPDCIDAFFETAGWYAIDPDGNILDAGVPPETGDTLWPPDSWQQ